MNTLLLIITCIILGVIAGLVYGVFGGGSGLIMTPGFYYVLHYFSLAQDHIMQIAIATTATVSALLGISATRVQWKNNLIDIAVFKKIFPGLLIGTLLAIMLLSIIPSTYLKHLFGLVVIFVAIWMGFYRQDCDTNIWPLASFFNRIMTTIIGLLWFLLGIAVFIVPYLHKCGVDLRRAIGCATLTSTIFSAIAALLLVITGLFEIGVSSNHIGYLDIPLSLIALMPSALAAHWGSKVSVKLPKFHLKIVYVGLLSIVGTLMLY